MKIENDIHIEEILNSLKHSDIFMNDYERDQAINTFQYAVDKFGLNSFYLYFDVGKSDYKKYFAKTVKKYDTSQHQEYMETFKKNKENT